MDPGRGPESEIVTLALPVALTDDLRVLARKHNQSLDELVVTLIANFVAGEARACTQRFVELARTTGLAPKTGDKRTWTREDAYRGKRFGDLE